MKTIYTDGSYQSSINAGGYAVVIMENDKVIKELYKGHKNTTNNREELRGVITALQSLKEDEEAVIISDSQYVLNNLPNAHTWFNDDTKKNIDLWKELVKQRDLHPKVRYQWTKGHNECIGNERADLLAVHAAQCLNLSTDNVTNI